MLTFKNEGGSGPAYSKLTAAVFEGKLCLRIYRGDGLSGPSVLLGPEAARYLAAEVQRRWPAPKEQPKSYEGAL